MAGIANWFSFASKEQRKQREEDYFRQMFPMGEAQKKREEELLKICIQTAISPNEKFYQLQIVKEALREPDEQRKKAALKKWYNASLTKKLPLEERAMLLALGELEQDCCSVGELPSPREIHQRSMSLLEEYLPKLQLDSTRSYRYRGRLKKLLQK